MSIKRFRLNKRILWLFGFIAAIYLLGTGVDIMNIDAAQYASMSREMLVNHHYLELFDRGKDYLDKPPMLFWITSQSLRLFGVNNFAYKLPSILFALLGIYSTFRLAGIYYSRRIAILSALVLASSQALFLTTNDIRTDTMLMSWVTLALWQLAAWFRHHQWQNFLLAFIAIAGGMLTKGPIAIMVPIFAFGAHFLLQRNFKQIFRWEYLIGILIIAVLITPFCIGLYRQFDLHPEKLMYGRTGTSGVRFFLWTQSFGRITGESTWNNGAGFFFQLENLLWGFLPWIIFFLIALVLEVRSLIRQRFRINAQQEAITTGGFIIAYCAIASSKYQLPHYIYVVLPLAAIITAKFLDRLFYENHFSLLFRWLNPLHIFILSALWLGALLIAVFVFPYPDILHALILAAGLGTFIFLCFYKKLAGRLRLLVLCIWSITGINIFLSTYFYPQLLQYQMGSRAGKFVHEYGVQKGKLAVYRTGNSDALCFYAQQIVRDMDTVTGIRPGTWVLTSPEGLRDLQQHYPLKIRMQGEDFSVQLLTAQFLNPATREKELQKYYLVEVE